MRDRPEPDASHVELAWLARSLDQAVALEGIENAPERAGCETLELGSELEHRRGAQALNRRENGGLAVGESASARHSPKSSSSSASQRQHSIPLARACASTS